MHQITYLGKRGKHCTAEQEARCRKVILVGINRFQEWMSDEASYKSENKFYDCNSQISHHNEFSIKCPPNPHWLMDEPLKQELSSKIYGSNHISEEMNAVSHKKLQASQGRWDHLPGHCLKAR